MRTLYIDCFAGIAGDMFLGALLDLGLDADEFRKKLSSLALGEYELQIRRGKRNGIAGTDVKVAVAPAHHDEQEDGHVHAHSHRGLKEIRAIIEGSGLSEEVKKQSLSAFQILARPRLPFTGPPPRKSIFTKSAPLIPLWTSSAPSFCLRCFRPTASARPTSTLEAAP